MTNTEDWQRAQAATHAMFYDRPWTEHRDTMLTMLTRGQQAEQERDAWKQDAQRYAANCDYAQRQVAELEAERAILWAFVVGVAGSTTLDETADVYARLPLEMRQRALTEARAARQNVQKRACSGPGGAQR